MLLKVGASAFDNRLPSPDQIRGHYLPIASEHWLVAFSTTDRKATPSGKRSKEVLMISKATVPQDTASHGAVSEDFKRQLAGYGLTTAEILYRRPDHRWLLQSYVWQNYDLFPKFPALQDFLSFWQDKLEGPLVSVTVAHSKLIKPAELKAIDGLFRLH
jgi:uncharacterized protein Usg